MDSVANLATLSSLTVYTLRRGSLEERLILGSALTVAGILVAQVVYKIAVYVFSKPQRAGALDKPKIDKKAEDEYEKQLREKVERLVPPPALSQNPPAPAPSSSSEPQAHSLLKSLVILDEPLPKEKESALAEALHAYQALKAEIEGDEERFVFLAEQYLNGPFPEKPLTWKEKNIEFDFLSQFNDAFQKLQEKLGRVRLTLAHVRRSDQPIAKAHFVNNSTEGIHSLAELYKTVKLLGPHILTSLEIPLQRTQLEEAKQRLHKTRLDILDKILSTLREVLINQMVTSFSLKQKELFTLFGEKPENLRFVLENSCWLALNHALEFIEITFVPTEKEQQKLWQSNLETLLTKGVPEGEKRRQAQAILLKIPHDTGAIEELVQFFKDEKDSHLQTLIQKVQQPQLQVEEERIQQELGRLEAVQKFYTTISFAAGVVDQGKIALLKKEEGQPKKQLIVRAVPLPPTPPPKEDPLTYAGQIHQVSGTVVQAGEGAIRTVASEQWQMIVKSIEEQSTEIPDISAEVMEQIIQAGWTEFKNKQLFLKMTKQQRWIVTEAMILRKLSLESLKNRGNAIVHEVGLWSASFVKTLYERLVTALLAFEQSTLKTTAQASKPADAIAEALINPLLESYHALQRVKKNKPKLEAGKREEDIVMELGRNQVHPNARKTETSDAVFLGKLIVELLSVLQPQGLSADIKKILANALSSSGELEPTLLRKIIEKCNKILPGIAPWVKPLWDFSLQGLQYFLEKQSARNIASQMSDWMDPENVNSFLADFFEEDTSEIIISERKGNKEPTKWYPEDEQTLRDNLIPTRAKLKEQITRCEKVLLDAKNGNIDVKQVMEEWVRLKKNAARLDRELVPLLLRRMIIANVPTTFVGYADPLVTDLHELILYPTILRNMIFKVLEKSVQTLAQSLEKNAADVNLKSTIHHATNQSVANLFFSDLLKTELGNKLIQLVWSLSPNPNSWSPWAFLAQTAARTVAPGYYVFLFLQKKIEVLTQKKFKDPEIINWSVAKLISTLNNKIIHFAKDDTKQGMTTLVATQLGKAFGAQPKEKEIAPSGATEL